MKKQIISILLVLALSLALLPQLALTSGAQTLSGACGANGDNLTWTLDEGTGVLTIAGSGDMKDYSTSSVAPWYGSLEQITSIVVSEGVTSIGARAFFGLRNVTEATLPSGLQRLGMRAFAGCRGLTGIAIPDSVTSIESAAFNGCSSLESVTVPYGVTSIGDNAFAGCDSLRDVVLPDGLTEIREYTFYNCDDLIHVTIPASVTSIGDFAFEGCEPWMYIYYSGTRDMWDAITIGSNNDALFDAALYCAVAMGTLGNLTWTLSAEGVLTITGSGAMEPGENGMPWYWKYDRNIKSVVISEGVTSICASAFQNCSYMTSVTIPASVTSIGSSAFSYCSSLMSVTISDGVISIGECAFWNCRSLESVTIPASVTSIGKQAFYGCSSLTRISVSEGNTEYSSDEAGILFDKEKTTLFCCPPTYSGAYVIPESVVIISEGAFSDCSGLTAVRIPEGVTSIGDDTFSFCSSLTSVTIPDRVISIGERAFSYCSSLIDVTIGSGVESISDYAFNGCDSLTRFSVAEGNTNYSSDEAGILFNKDKTTLLFCPRAYSGDYAIPEGVMIIPEEAFRGCGAITGVTIPDSVTSIGARAFCECSNLAGVTIGSGVTLIGVEAFSDCSALTGVTIGSGVTNIGDMAFYGCASLTDLTIPDSVTSIGEGAFSDCSALTAVTIPDSVTSIGSSAFSGCSALSAVTIPDSVTSIGSSAFSGCSSLTGVKIPDGVTRIGSGAFSGCSSLTDVTIPDSVTRIGSGAFYGTGYYQTQSNWVNGLLSVSNWIIASEPSITEASFRPGTVGIADTVFYGHSSLISVTFPDSIAVIGGGAFEDCASLHDFSLPQNMDYVGAEAFAGTAFSRDPASWQDGTLCKDHVLLFYDLKESDFRIPDGTYLVADEVFDYSDYGYVQDAGYATDETVPDDSGPDAADAPTQRSGWMLLDDETGKWIWPNENLTIFVPASVRRISGSLRSSSIVPIAATQIYPFQPKVEVDPQNEWFCSDSEGALFSKDMTKLISCPSVRTGVYFVPESVESVGAFAFARSELGTVVLPQSVACVQEAAFRDSKAAVFLLNPDCAIEPYDAIDWGAGTNPLLTYDATLGEGLICSYRGSAAETYAAEHGYKFHALPDGFTADEVFLDVNGSSYYMEPVLWAVENGVTNGTGARLFSPQESCTRAQVATFLWRAAGSPEPASLSAGGAEQSEVEGNTSLSEGGAERSEAEGNTSLSEGGAERSEAEGVVNPFTDIAEGSYYYKAVLWAVENGITNGMDATHFGPATPCNRGQVVTFLWRAKGSPEPTSTACPFEDVSENAYYYKAMLWAVENGITNGVDETHFAPNNPCTRGQVVTFLYRAFHE